MPLIQPHHSGHLDFLALAQTVYGYIYLGAGGLMVITLEVVVTLSPEFFLSVIGTGYTKVQGTTL